MLKNNEQLNIKGYKWVGKNRRNKNGGGVGILISSKYAGSTTEITHLESNGNLEVVWIRLETRPKNIALGVFYGPQEKESIESTKGTYNILETQILQLQKDNEIILGGDFNAKLQIDNEKGNQEISRNGKLLEQMIQKTKLTPTNLKTQEGLWTRVNRKNPTEKSVIDYILTSNLVEENITETTVDEGGELRLKGKKETDHNTITMSLKINNPRKAVFKEQWKINNLEGWAKFNQEVENKYAKQLFNTRDYETTMQEIKQILRQTVGKRRIRIDKPPKPKSKEIDTVRKERKETKAAFNNACKGNSEDMKIQTKIQYKEAQHKLQPKQR